MNFEALFKEAEGMRDQVVSWYHDLHRFPELSLQEYETTEYIMNQLREWGIEPFRLDDTGCLAYIGKDREDLMTLALRADIDGLPVREETGLAFSSQAEGRMHACGHDGHVAGLLGAAALLKKYEDELPLRVKLIFQASEENTQGAKRLIDLGVLKDVDRIFGLHLFSDIPTGILSLEGGERMAQTDRFSLTFTGRGGHAAKPHLCVDASLMAARFLVDLQSLVSREIDPVQGAVATVGSLHSGNQYNVISGEARMEGTCRCYSEEISLKLEDGIRRRAQAIAMSSGGQVQVDYVRACHPPVVNDPAYAEEILGKARKRIGEDYFKPVRPLMLGEDFSWYQKEIPGVFAFVGCGKPDGEIYPNHHACFQIDEDALPFGLFLHLCAVEACCH